MKEKMPNYLAVCSFYMFSLSAFAAGTETTVHFDPHTGSATELPLVEADHIATGAAVLGTGPDIDAAKIAIEALEAFAAATPSVAPGSPPPLFEGDTGSIPFGVVGDDDREGVSPTTGFPARAVVHLLFDSASGSPSLCSGSMIAADTVLTAGHCVYNLGWHRNYEVFPGRNGANRYFEPCGVSAVLTVKSWVENMAGDHDLAALKLDCTVGEKTGYFGIRALGDNELGAPTILQGYPGEPTLRGRQYRSRDEIREIRALKVDYENDTTGGMSGSPVFSDDLVLFAVHTGTTKAPGWTRENQVGIINHGTRLTADRIQLIQSWIEM